MVIAEEFGEWDESRRRIDLLAIDTEANLVVIELKRTEDGGHMDLQAIRYAAMVSTMTFQQAVEAYRCHLDSQQRDEDPEAAILLHLGWDEPDEEAFAQDVRIVLASAQFSRELTTAVLWLNERGLDVRCVRLIPYADGDGVLLDVQHLIPLPEAADYQERVREKAQRKRESRRSSRDYAKYDVTIDGATLTALAKREAVFRVVKHLCAQGVSPDDICGRVTRRKANAFRSVEGTVNDESEFLARIVAEERDLGRKFDPSRWYVGDEERIEADGRTYVLTNQWGGRALEWIEQVLAAFPSYKVSIQRSDLE